MAEKIVKKVALGCVLLSSAFSSPVSAATFLGDRFEGSYRFPRLQNATIDGGITVVSPIAQFNFGTGRINPTAKISASDVIITFAGSGAYRGAEFNGILLKNLSRSNIAAIALDPSSTLTGFDQSRLSFTSESMLFNFEGLSIRQTDRIVARVSFVTSAVPESATWALMLLGFGAIGAALRQRQKDVLRVRYTF